MNPEEATLIIVGRTVGLFPQEVVRLLNNSGATVDAQTYSLEKLVDATLKALSENKMFLDGFSQLVESNKNII
jgi:hypothetical protein